MYRHKYKIQKLRIQGGKEKENEAQKYIEK